MTVSFDDIRGEVLPAAGSTAHLVARVPGIVIVIRRDGPSGEAAAADLLALIREAAVEAAPNPGNMLARTLTEWVVRTRQAPGFGTIAATDAGIAVFLHGDVSVYELPEPGVAAGAADRLRLSGRTAAFTVDRLLPLPAGPLVLSAGEMPDPEEGDTAFGVFGWSGLVQGLVPGNGIVLGAPTTAAGRSSGRHSYQPADGTEAKPEPRGTPPAAEPTQAHQDARPSREPTVEAPVPEPEPEPLPDQFVKRFKSEPIFSSLPVEPAPPLPVASPPVAVPPAEPPPPPPGSQPLDLRRPELSEQIHGSHEHVVPRPPLPVAGGPGGDKAGDGSAKDGRPKSAGPRPGAPAGPAHVLVKGFRCSRNHHNDPRVSFCSVCGIRMDQRTGVLIDGRRPPLGLLVLDIGSTFVLDDNYLLGRNPEVDDAVIASRVRPIRLDDDSGTLSRVHAEIRLEGWDVLLLDRGSANGTYVASAGQSGWNRLAPLRPIVLTPGTHVRVGRRVFTFESAHARI